MLDRLKKWIDRSCSCQLRGALSRVSSMELLESRTVLSHTVLIVAEIDAPHSEPQSAFALPASYSRMPWFDQGVGSHAGLPVGSHGLDEHRGGVAAVSDSHVSDRPPGLPRLDDPGNGPHDHDFLSEPAPEGEAPDSPRETAFGPPGNTAGNTAHESAPATNGSLANNLNVGVGPLPLNSRPIDGSGSGVSNANSFPIAAGASWSATMPQGESRYQDSMDVRGRVNIASGDDSVWPESQTASNRQQSSAELPRGNAGTEGGWIELEVPAQRTVRGTRSIGTDDSATSTTEYAIGSHGRSGRMFRTENIELSDSWQPAVNGLVVPVLDAGSPRLADERLGQDDGMIELLATAHTSQADWRVAEPVNTRRQGAPIDVTDTLRLPADVGLYQVFELAADPAGAEGSPASVPVASGAADEVFGEIGANAEVVRESPAIDEPPTADAAVQAASIFSFLLVAVATRRIDRKRTDEEAARDQAARED